MSHREAGISLSTFPTPWFAWALSAGILAVLRFSAWPIQDLPRTSLHPFVSFTALWSGLWGFLTALKYALTCSTFCLVCISGRSSMNLVGSVGVSLVVPSMTRIASFCTVSSFSRFVCPTVVEPRPLSVTPSTTLWYSRKRWYCSKPFAAIAFRTDRPFLHFSAVSTCL